MCTTPLRPVTLAFLISCAALLVACGNSNQIHVCNVAPGCCGPQAACPIPQYLFAAGTSGQISTFPVNGPSGALGAPTSTTGPQATLGMAVLNNMFLYASNPVATSGGSVDAWMFNLGAGTLSPVSGSPFSLGPFGTAGGLAVNSNAQVLYVADAGKIDALHADATGALTPIAGSPFAAGSGLFLAVANGQFLFASDTTPPGNVLAYTIDPTGALTAAPGSPFPAVPTSQTATQPNQIVVDSSGKFVYVGLLTTNQVAGFSIDSSTGALTAVPGSPFSTGGGPLSLATANNLLYVSNAMDGTTSGYMIDATTGVLTPLAGSPFAIGAGALTTNPWGTTLYASDAQGILVLSIESTTGALTPVGAPVSSPGATVLVYVP